jgi:hypothetical protein
MLHGKHRFGGRLCQCIGHAPALQNPIRLVSHGMAQELQLLITCTCSMALDGSILRKFSVGLTCNDGLESAVQNQTLIAF